MPLSTPNSGATHPWPHPSNDASALSRFEKWLPTLLSIIAGMVDLTGFLSLGNLFTAHITGNLVVVGALVARRGQINPAQILAIPVFILAVSAMACQFALLRLTLPVAPSTAVMTGNLTNTVLSLLDRQSRTQPLMTGDTERLRGSLYLLIGFFGGCVVGAVAVSWLGDWAWSFPVALAGVAVML